MKYNPTTDFICYAREKYGDATVACYKEEGICSCHEDRELIGKSRMEWGCTPAETILDMRSEYIKNHKDKIQKNQDKLINIGG
tara:strand:+ start:673 stop:921 length:249 start_codon:yes stop_codon:yes gene_type:complete